jgi:hypothetical protein
MLTTSQSNGTRRAQGGHRYWVQWVTDQKQTDMKVIGYCVRDMDKFDKNIVFEHDSKIVCEKIAGLLNEGVSDGLSKRS